MITRRGRPKRTLPLIAVSVLVLAVLLALRIAARPAGKDLDEFPMPPCSMPDAGTASGRVYHVNPFTGREDGDGSRQHPWNDLQAAIDRGLVGEARREVQLADRLLGAITHRAVPVRLRERPAAVVRGGDTILLADGDHGTLDLSRLANRGFLTIAAAPGARPVLRGLRAGGASHFVLRGITIAGQTPLPGLRHLASTHAHGPARADNIVFDRVDVSWTNAVGTIAPAAWADAAPSGLQLGGDCMTVRDSAFHDLKVALTVFRGREVLIEGNAISDITVDGIDFSGRDIVIRANTITDHWATPDPLHPECMQGHSPDGQTFGPVLIERNVCVGETAARERPQAWREPSRGGWMGIDVFDGRWRGITVRCNLVLPDAQHGIALYGVEQAVVEGNTVVGNPRRRPSWIAVMPSKEGRPPVAAVIRENRATGYLNAVHGAPREPEAMLDVVGAWRHDKALMKALSAPIPGVRLEGNVWLLVPSDARSPEGDGRFGFEVLPERRIPRDIADARRRFPLPAACGAPI